MRIIKLDFKDKKTWYFAALIGVIAALLFLFCLSGTARAGGSSGVWPVQLVPDGTVTSGADSGASVYVVDFTTKARYTGNVMGQLTGVTLSAVSPWPPAADTGVSIYYADLLVKPAAGASMLDLVKWTLIDTPTTLLTGNTVYAFDIPFNPAAPYGALKFVWSGASPFSYGFRYSTSGNP
jgi:hypothetical protein